MVAGVDGSMAESGRRKSYGATRGAGTSSCWERSQDAGVNFSPMTLWGSEVRQGQVRVAVGAVLSKEHVTGDQSGSSIRMTNDSQ